MKRPLFVPLSLALLAAACADEGDDQVLVADAAVADAAGGRPASDTAVDAPQPFDEAPGDLAADVSADAVADLAMDVAAEAAPGDGGCLGVQPSTKLYEYWCDPLMPAKQLCFRESYIHL